MVFRPVTLMKVPVPAKASVVDQVLYGDLRIRHPIVQLTRRIELGEIRCLASHGNSVLLFQL